MQVVVGRVAKAHGVTGEMVVEVRTDDPQGRFAPGERLQAAHPRDRSSRREVVVQTVRDHGARLLLRVVGVDDRDGADALRGSLLLVDTAALPPIDDPDEYYDHQLVGLRVCTASGDAVGTVTDVLHTGAGEVLTVRTGKDAAGAGDNADGEVLVPFVAAIVTEVRLEDGVITIDPPDGLLDPA